MLSSSKAIINKHLDKQKIPYKYSIQTRALPLNAKHYILRNKMAELNDLKEPLWNEQGLYNWKHPYPYL